QRKLALHRGDRMHRMGPPDAFRPRLAQPEKAYLALLDEPRHRADRVLDRHRRIDAMLVIEVDYIDAEPLEARLAGLRDIGGGAVDAVGAARLAGLAEFARDYDPVAPALQRPAEQFLVLAPAVHVRAVKMIDAQLDCPVDQPDSGRVVARAVDPRQGHA